MANKNHEKFFTDKMLACPLRGQWVSFRLVDELGTGHSYGGLTYKIVDSEGQQYNGILDAQGFAKLENCYKGAVIISFDEPHDRSNETYWKLMRRKAYPLPITELQVRAEETRFFHEDGSRVEYNPAQKDADEFIQVEVRDLVKHGAHLPPVAKRFYPPRQSAFKALAELTFGYEQSERWGVVLMPNKHSVLEVRPLRALRPMLSTDKEFCALNLYQLAVMATMSYSDFGQQPLQPVDKVRFPLDPSSGNLFGEALASYKEVWRVDADQSAPFYPIYEDVPYSKRFEILPFNPVLYPQNHPDLIAEQEHPANVHFFDNGEGLFSGDTQAFICHHDEVILITIRGTASWTDAFRDADAAQVPFDEADGKVHRGFYNAYLSIRKFVQRYLSRFHSGQKVIICGHSLGGAIATLLAEAVRRDTTQKHDVVLYTYGSPRAGDATFVAGATELVHHRIVNNNDPAPSVPSTWMDANWKVWLPGVLVLPRPYSWLMFAFGLVRIGGEPYQHHGKQQHFMPVKFGGEETSSVLWDPGCESIEDVGICKLAHEQKKLKRNGDDMPARAGLIRQIAQADDHKMVDSYIPLAWATLRRWQETLEANQTVVTDREYRFIERAIEQLRDEIENQDRALRKGPRNIDEIIAATHRREEINRLGVAILRLGKLNATKLKPTDVYGNAAQSPELEASLKRWMAHKENSANVQLAMIPSRPDSIYIAGVYQEVDPDPMA